MRKRRRPISDRSKRLGATMSKTLSPFTVATGEKARAILDQMRRGDTFIYQTLGINQAASTTGRAKLGPDFMAALAKKNAGCNAH